MPRGPETPIPIRAGILALHLFTDMNWVDISTKFLVHPDTAKKICQRAKVPLPPLPLPFSRTKELTFLGRTGTSSRRKRERSICSPGGRGADGEAKEARRRHGRRRRSRRGGEDAGCRVAGL